MRKLFKNISLFGLVLVGLTSCGNVNNEAQTIMNVEVNPEVEFVLDYNNKVISVSANNEDGNLVISSKEFENIEGKSAETAVEIFISVSHELGFIFEGELASDENEIEISISGDLSKAKEIYNDVKTTITEYFSKENIKAKIDELETVTKAELEELVLECEPYLDMAEVKAMEYKELLANIAKSRKETQELYSEELKKAYYDAKQFALEQAELTVLKENLTSIGQLTVDGLNKVYTALIEEIEEARYNHLIKEDSLYQKALASFREAKIEFLNYRNYVASLPKEEVNEEKLVQLEKLSNLLDIAEEQLEKAYEVANNMIEELKASLGKAYNAVIEALKKFEIYASNYLDKISESQKTAITEITENFENKYSEARAYQNSKMEEMRKALSKSN